jgi:hypothetical protein
MITPEDRSILSEPETTFEIGSDEIKAKVDQLMAEGTPESHDELLKLAADHGVPVSPEMPDEEVKSRIYAVL